MSTYDAFDVVEVMRPLVAERDQLRADLAKAREPVRVEMPKQTLKGYGEIYLADEIHEAIRKAGCIPVRDGKEIQ